MRLSLVYRNTSFIKEAVFVYLIEFDSYVFKDQPIEWCLMSLSPSGLLPFPCKFLSRSTSLWIAMHMSSLDHVDLAWGSIWIYSFALPVTEGSKMPVGGIFGPKRVLIQYYLLITGGNATKCKIPPSFLMRQLSSASGPIAIQTKVLMSMNSPITSIISPIV